MGFILCSLLLALTLLQGAKLCSGLYSSCSRDCKQSAQLLARCLWPKHEEWKRHRNRVAEEISSLDLRAQED